MAEYLFEYYPVGRFVRVSVIDTRTNEEATIVADRGACQDHIERIALQKLARLRRRRDEEQQQAVTSPTPEGEKFADEPAKDGQGGIHSAGVVDVKV